MNPNVKTLYRVDDVHGLFVDAIVQRVTGSLLFGSFWGRDTAVQEFLARLSLPPQEEDSLAAVDLTDVDHPDGHKNKVRIWFDDPARLAKLTGRMPAASLFGPVVQVWIYEPLVMEPDVAGRRALRILLAESELSQVEQREAAFHSDAAWVLLKSASHLPLLDEWRGTVIKTAVVQNWLKFHYGTRVNGLEINLGSDDGFEKTISELIKNGRLRLPGGEMMPGEGNDDAVEPLACLGEMDSNRRLTSAELEHQMGYFIGTTQWFRHCLNTAMLYTEGVQFFAEQGGQQGAYWFLDIVATEYFSMLRDEDFLLIRMSVMDRKALIRVENGSCRLLKEKCIDYTDMQSGEWTFYLTNSVLLLPSEN